MMSCSREAPLQPELEPEPGIPPVARFTASPDSGTVLTFFRFDASESTPGEGIFEDLRYRWQFGIDEPGLGWFLNPTVPHQFEKSGDYLVSLVVRNSAGLCDTTRHEIFVREVPQATIYWIGSGGTRRGTTPAISESGVLYMSDYFGDLQALNPDGSRRWVFDLYDPASTSPAIAEDGSIYFGSDHGVYAINPNGTLKWRFETDGDMCADPAIGADGTIYIGSNDGHIYALNSDGTLKWRKETGWTESGVAIDADGTIYIGSNGDKLYAFNPDGSLKWEQELTDGIFSSPAIGNDGTIYVSTSDGMLWAINGGSGSPKWTIKIGNVVNTSPSIGEDGTIYIGACSYTEGDAGLLAVDPGGVIRWRYGDLSNMWGTAPLVAENGLIYMAATDQYGKAVIVGIDREGVLQWYSWLAPYGEGGADGSPAIGLDGVIYIGSGSDLYALVSPSGGLANSPWPKSRGNLQNTGMVR